MGIPKATKEISLSIPQIPVPGGFNGRSFNMNFFFDLPTTPEFGNMGLKNYDYGQRHHFVNSLLREIFIDHELEKESRKGEMVTIDNLFYKIKNQTETVIYWIRKTADDLIGVAYFVFKIYVQKIGVDKIDIDSIGRLQFCPEQEFKDVFKDHMTHLEELNNVSNSYKHSFIQYESGHLIGKNEPTVVALYLRKNSTQYDPEYYSLSLRSVINNYSNFFIHAYEQVKQWMEEWFQNLKTEHENKTREKISD